MKTLKNVLLIVGILILNLFSAQAQHVKASSADELVQLIVDKYPKGLLLNEIQQEALFKETIAYIETMEQEEKWTAKNNAEKTRHKAG